MQILQYIKLENGQIKALAEEPSISNTDRLPLCWLGIENAINQNSVNQEQEMLEKIGQALTTKLIPERLYLAQSVCCRSWSDRDNRLARTIVVHVAVFEIN